MSREVRCGRYSEAIGPKNVKPNTYVISPLQEFPGIQEFYCLVVDFPQAGEGYVKKGGSYWCLETFSNQTGVETKPQN